MTPIICSKFWKLDLDIIPMSISFCWNQKNLDNPPPQKNENFQRFSGAVRRKRIGTMQTLILQVKKL